MGSVSLHPRASVWYCAVLRADGDVIAPGEGSNAQDGVVIHADPGQPVIVGADVSIGHRAVLHGCRLGDGTLVGMGAVILDGAEVGPGCLVAAGAVVPERRRFGPGPVIAGVPARVSRLLEAKERVSVVHNARQYVELSQRHREALRS